MSGINIVLDPDYLDKTFQIYEVEGVHGTLKELSDYFNVDPISVSDGMVDGMSIEDAICAAKPANPIIDGKKKRGKVGRRPSASSINSNRKHKTVVKGSADVNGMPVVANVPEIKTISGAPMSIKATSDIQDLGEFIIVTTTTTAIYRKDEIK